MIKLLTIFLFSLWHFTPSDSIANAKKLEITAQKAVAADNCLLFYSDNLLFLISDTNKYSFLPQNTILDLDTYGGLINATLDAQFNITTLDNKLNPIFSITLDNQNFTFPTKIRFYTSNQLAIYDQFDNSIKIIEIPSGEIQQTFQLSEEITNFKIWKNKIYLLSTSKLTVINLISGSIETQIPTAAKDLTFYRQKILLLLDSSLVIYSTANIDTLALKSHFQSIIGWFKQELILKDLNNQLFALKIKFSEQ